MARVEPWPHLTTRHDELRFEHHTLDPRDNMPGCLVIRPPAGKVVHLGLSRPMIAAPQMLAALKGARELLGGIPPHDPNRHYLDAINAAISAAGE